MSEKKPIAFMSYVHADNRDEKLTEFRKYLSNEVEMQIGEEFHIFQDRDDILWGQNWEKRIYHELAEITFFIPIITPSFFNSTPCRDELAKFLQREEKLN
ncbi:MAG: toll/interleukin-1 receptor domain-containing protein [Candidatus Zixiibacteriota bacterium]